MTLWFRSTEWQTYYVEGQTFRPDNEGYIEIPENVAAQIRDPTLVYVGRERPSVPIAERDGGQKPAKARTGRPAEFDWDEVWAEICRSVHDEGLPERQAKLIERVQQWCEDRYGKQPSDSTLKPKIRKVYEALRRCED
jgi:hypothetical protein